MKSLHFLLLLSSRLGLLGLFLSQGLQSTLGGPIFFLILLLQPQLLA